MEESLERHFNKMPLLFFRIMLEDDPDGALARLSPCLWGDFVHGFVRQTHEEGETLAGDISQARVEMVLKLADVCISRIEIGHAALRRRLFARSVHTKGYDLEQLSADHVLEKTRHTGKMSSWFLREMRDASGQAIGARQAAALAGGDRREDRARSSGGGGLWRAFIRHSTLGHKRAADFTQLAEKYKTIDDNLRQQLLEQGARATQHNRDTAGGLQRSLSSFGPTSREVQRRQAKLRREGAVQRALGNGDAPHQALDDEAAVAVVQRAQRGEITVQQAMTSARLQRCVHRDVLARRAEQDAGQVRAHVEQLDQAKASLVAALPPLAGFPGELRPVATSSTSTMALVPEVESSKTLVQMLHASRQKTNLGQALDNDWKSKHQPILHDKCVPLPDAVPRKGRPPCDEAGVCLCSPKGKQTFHLRNRVSARDEVRVPQAAPGAQEDAREPGSGRAATRAPSSGDEFLGSGCWRRLGREERLALHAHWPPLVQPVLFVFP